MSHPYSLIHTAKLLRESWQIVRGPLFLSSSDGRLWISDWTLHTDSDEAYAPSVRINRKSSLLSAWLIGILVSVSLRVQMNPDELFLVDKRSNIRVSPSVAARCFLLSWTDLSHGLSRKFPDGFFMSLAHGFQRKKDDKSACMSSLFESCNYITQNVRFDYSAVSDIEGKMKRHVFSIRIFKYRKYRTNQISPEFSFSR